MKKKTVVVKLKEIQEYLPSWSEQYKLVWMLINELTPKHIDNRGENVRGAILTIEYNSPGKNTIHKAFLPWESYQTVDFGECIMKVYIESVSLES